jgi:hypothetical protein
MPRKKGLPKTGGRKPGSVNKTGATLREKITTWLEDNFESNINDIKALSPDLRVKAYRELLKFGLPELSNVSSTIDFENMTDGQLQQIVDTLIKKAEAKNNEQPEQ